jgi:DNA-binding NtrC family response regulator
MVKERGRILLITGNVYLAEAMNVILKEDYEISVAETKEMDALKPEIKNRIIIVDLTDTGIIPNEMTLLTAESKTPVIAVIDSSNLELKREVIRAGIYDYLEIPLDRERALILTKRALSNGPRAVGKQKKEI